MLEPDRLAKSKASIHAAIAAAPAWHASPEGLEWHRRNGMDAWRGRPKSDHVCVVCGAKFQTRTPRATVCSPKCFAKRRRDSGLDDAQRSCPECAAGFMANRYSKQVCCSVSCATRVKNRARRV